MRECVRDLDTVIARSGSATVVSCAESARRMLRYEVPLRPFHVRADGGVPRRDTGTRRREAQALRALLTRLPGHLGLVVLPPHDRSLALGALTRWRLVSWRLGEPLGPLPFPPASFDAVLLVHVLDEGIDPRTLLVETVRVLALQGRLVTVVRHPLAPGRRGGRFLPVAKLVRAQGLRIESDTVLYGPLTRRLPVLRIRPLDRIVVARRPPPPAGLLLPGRSARRLSGSLPQGSRFQP